jgi:hypothetical protein
MQCVLELFAEERTNVVSVGACDALEERRQLGQLGVGWVFEEAFDRDSVLNLATCVSPRRIRPHADAQRTW